MKRVPITFGLLAAVAAVAIAAAPAEAKHGAGGGGGHASGHSSAGGGRSVSHSVGVRAPSFSAARAAPAVRFAPAVRHAPAVRSAPVPHTAAKASSHRVANAGHRQHRRGGGYVTYVDEGPYYYYDTEYSDDCGWLLRKARATGKRYWWNRYYECIEE